MPTTSKPLRTTKAWADELRRRLPANHTVELYTTSDTPYRKPKGLRYRTWTGKTRYGPAIRVTNGAGQQVFHWSSVETYRRLVDIERWVNSYVPN